MFPGLPVDKKLELHSVDPNLPYRSISNILPVDFDEAVDSVLFKQPGPKLYRVDAGGVLDESDLNQAFEEGYLIVKEKAWMAYSEFSEKKVTTKENVILDEAGRDRVYYPNCMEWVVSGMEFSCVAAKNTAILIYNKEKESE